MGYVPLIGSVQLGPGYIQLLVEFHVGMGSLVVQFKVGILVSGALFWVWGSTAGWARMSSWVTRRMLMDWGWWMALSWWMDMPWRSTIESSSSSVAENMGWWTSTVRMVWRSSSWRVHGMVYCLWILTWLICET